MDFSRVKPLLYPIWRPALGLVAIGLASWIILSVLHGSAADIRGEAPAATVKTASIISGQTVVTLDLPQQKAAGIVLQKIHNGVLPQTIRAYGVAIDPQTLAELHNGYVNATAQLAMAKAKQHQSQLAFARAEKLFAAQALSAADRDAAEATYRVDQATVSADASQAQTLEETAQQNWGTPLSEAILKGTDLYRAITARKAVLIQTSLSPGQILAKPPHTARLELDDGTRLALQFVSVAPKTDARIQGASYFYTAPANPGLLPGMNVTVALVSDKTQKGDQVPDTAVVWWRGAAWVYEQVAPTEFVRHALTDNAAAETSQYIVTGLTDGTPIVVRGAQDLLSQEFRPQPSTAGEDND